MWLLLLGVVGSRMQLSRIRACVSVLGQQLQVRRGGREGEGYRCSAAHACLSVT